ncbi:Alpha/Beta hydrolase protein [Amylocystis lapponica]|nr:Alpha/Beta hydrolase protein [Amylocystis lapponica]
MSSLILSTLLLAAVSSVNAIPALRPRQSITSLSSGKIDYFTPYSYYAGAGYCPANETASWNCGTNCEANSGFKPVASGGDGDSTQYWFVGYDPSLTTVIVSHQGTKPSDFLSLLTDGDIAKTTLDSDLFPGLSSDIEVHEGFADAQSSTASDVLSAVQKAISTYSAKQVTIVGHSLGGAIALLDAVYLPLHVSDVSFTYIGYGLPRVGNQAFADYVDGMGVSITHVNNEEDPIPIVPGRFLGYAHPSGEVHIADSGEWASCPGQDNTSTQCSTGDVPNIVDGTLSEHDGPYNGVHMGC